MLCCNHLWSEASEVWFRLGLAHVLSLVHFPDPTCGSWNEGWSTLPAVVTRRTTPLAWWTNGDRLRDRLFTPLVHIGHRRTRQHLHVVPPPLSVRGRFVVGH